MRHEKGAGSKDPAPEIPSRPMAQAFTGASCQMNSITPTNKNAAPTNTILRD
jgi:hypothetical protein